MKKLAATLCLGAVTLGAFAQGTISFINGTATMVSTNSAALGSGLSGTRGATTPTAQSFYYAVFTAPSTVTSIGNASTWAADASWTFTGAYGTNLTTATGGRLNGG